ncbi:STAS domain-containing protein [Bacillus sp. FJAT-42376]|uniref:STAS domain-containing protein n=1 Tax=Bacillus sp. FJAT-42376 TaxID=2014076 RepID=UPI000F502152|nr:STAS domain-containing protein [Bacillus sp. FJAT-42376]AZB41383.1 STAS domain-containing protein [Bacillus sp. FJAT-42376]
MNRETNPISAFLRQNQSEIADEWVEGLKELDDRKYSELMSESAYINTAQEFIAILLQYMEGSKEDLGQSVSDFSSRLVQAGWSLTFITKGIKQLGLILFDKMTRDASEADKMQLVWEFDQKFSPITEELLLEYASSWERTVSLQKIALQELSAPLIPVFEHITVMPLVGTIDTERAKRIMENLLDGVVKHRSQVVLIDITGVPVVDTMVAHHIIQASEAVRLVGAKCLLVGIRPEIAQTIVNLGINLSQITTKNSLQKGIEAALEMTNRNIVSTEELK